jgi:stringent starvation protein B
VTKPSTKPYLLRAMYQWCVDYGFTPYLSVKVDGNTRVPLEHVKDGVIVLNIGPNATRHFTISNDEVAFYTRFNGVSREVLVPIGAVTGIFSRENGEGLAFPAEAAAEGAAQDSPSVAEDLELDSGNNRAQGTQKSGPVVASSASKKRSGSEGAEVKPPDDQSGGAKGRARLRVVK